MNVFVNITVDGKEKGTFVIDCPAGKVLGFVLDRACEKELIDKLKDLDSYALLYNGTKLTVSDPVAEVLKTAGKDAATAITLDVTKAPSKPTSQAAVGWCRGGGGRQWGRVSTHTDVCVCVCARALVSAKAGVNRRHARNRFRGSSVDEGLYYALIDD